MVMHALEPLVVVHLRLGERLLVFHERVFFLVVLFGYLMRCKFDS
jgi:hypothetical protein